MGSTVPSALVLLVFLLLSVTCMFEFDVACLL